MSFKKKLVISAFVFALSFLLIDFTLARIVPKKCSVARPDEFLYLILVPNSVCKDKNKEFEVTYSINQHGLRESQFELEKENSVRRILFMGDSFTYGTGVNLHETFVKQLEVVLNNRSTDKKFQTINAGVPSYGLILEHLYLKNDGIKLQPDLVVVNLNITDFFDERRLLKRAIKDKNGQIVGVTAPKKKEYLPKALDTWLKNNSFSYNLFLENEENLLRLRGKIIAFIKSKELPEYAKEASDFMINDPDRDTFAITREINGELFDELFLPVAQRLQEIKKFLDENSIPMIIIVIPSGHQINSNQWEDGRKVMKLTDTQYPDRIFLELEDFAKNNGIVLLNPILQIRESAKNTQNKLYFDFDGHFTPFGHQVFAKSLFNLLMEKRADLFN